MQSNKLPRKKLKNLSFRCVGGKRTCQVFREDVIDASVTSFPVSGVIVRRFNVVFGSFEKCPRCSSAVMHAISSMVGHATLSGKLCRFKKERIFSNNYEKLWFWYVFEGVFACMRERNNDLQLSYLVDGIVLKTEIELVEGSILVLVLELEMALIVAFMSLELYLKLETLLDGLNLAGWEVNKVFIVYILVVFSFHARRERNGGVTLSLHIHREPGLRQRVRSHLHHHLLIHLTAIPCLLPRDRDVTATARLKRRNFLNIYVQRNTYCRRSEDFNGLNGLCDFRNSLIYFSLEIFLKVCIFSDRSMEFLDHKQASNFFVCAISFRFLSVKISKVSALCLRYVFYFLFSCLGRSFQMKCLNSIELYTGLNLVRTKKYGILNSRNYRNHIIIITMSSRILQRFSSSYLVRE
jgi:hypothetical protein